MDTGVPAAGPWLVLALATLGLLVDGVLLARAERGRNGTPPPGRPALVEDDLPRFHASPPGSRPVRRPRHTATHVPLAGVDAPVPLAAPPPRAAVRLPSETPPGAPASGARVPAALVAGALVVIALVAVVALVSRGSSPTAPTEGAAPATPAPPEASLPVPPASPAAGEGGAGELAYRSLPLLRGGESVRLSFAGVVLEPYAVGVRAAYPTVGVTRSGSQALAHVQLPTWNCFAGVAPADPAAAGCAASLTEYGDLPTPALTVSRSDGQLTLAGRFATYTRPNGSGPVYTGRVYDLTVTVTEGRAGRDRRAPVSGTFTLGGQTARTVGGPVLNGVQFGR